METIIPEELSGLLTGIDLRVMLAIAVLAGALRQSTVSRTVAFWFPTALGGALGLMASFAAPGELTGVAFAHTAIVSFVVNGAAATVIARVATTKVAGWLGYDDKPPPLKE